MRGGSPAAETDHVWAAAAHISPLCKVAGPPAKIDRLIDTPVATNGTCKGRTGIAAGAMPVRVLSRGHATVGAVTGLGEDGVPTAGRESHSASLMRRMR
jgi:hypothetical protein